MAIYNSLPNNFRLKLEIIKILAQLVKPVWLSEEILARRLCW